MLSPKLELLRVLNWRLPVSVAGKPDQLDLWGSCLNYSRVMVTVCKQRQLRLTLQYLRKKSQENVVADNLAVSTSLVLRNVYLEQVQGNCTDHNNYRLLQRQQITSNVKSIKGKSILIVRKQGIYGSDKGSYNAKTGLRDSNIIPVKKLGKKLKQGFRVSCLKNRLYKDPILCINFSNSLNKLLDVFRKISPKCHLSQKKGSCISSSQAAT